MDKEKLASLLEKHAEHLTDSEWRGTTGKLLARLLELEEKVAALETRLDS